MERSQKISRVVLITGAGGGLGQGLVAEFAAHGWRVIAAHHRAPAQPETDRVWPVAMDVTHRAEIEAVVGRVLERWGRVDALVNNAGLTADRLSWQLDDAGWDGVLAVNLKGAFLCSRAVVRTLLRQRDGHIINIASFIARAGAQGQANYAAAKAGVIGLTESLAKEVGSRNIRVNAVLPGVLPTPMATRLPAERLQARIAGNVLGRINSIAEVARCVVFLAATQNISGQVFQLDSRIGRWT